MTTKNIAHWALNLTTIPPTVRKAALRSLYNYLGRAIGGSNHPTVTEAHSALSPLFGKATPTLLGTAGKADARHAALLSGIASHVHDYDDTHLATIIHPTGPIASALLAYAEYQDTPLRGEDLLLALVAGIETSCKLGLAVWPEHYDIGWHITGTTGVVGAAVAVGKLMRLTNLEMSHAIGIAAAKVIGLREMFGSDTKSFHPGKAAADGIMAALLARSGWANVVAGGGAGASNLEPTLESLGKTWEVEVNSIKPFPCGIVCHPAIDAAIQCHEELRQNGNDPSEVQEVSLQVHPLVIELTSKRYPRDGLEAKFSVYHGCAVGLLYGKAGPAEYEDHVVTRPEVKELRDRIQTSSEASFKADEARLRITHPANGIEKHIMHAVGSLDVPMTDEQLQVKFKDQVSPVVGDSKSTEASNAAWALGEADDVLPIIRQLCSQ